MGRCLIDLTLKGFVTLILLFVDVLEQFDGSCLYFDPLLLYLRRFSNIYLVWLRRLKLKWYRGLNVGETMV